MQFSPCHCPGILNKSVFHIFLDKGTVVSKV